MSRSRTSRSRGIPCTHDADVRSTRTGTSVMSAASATRRASSGDASGIASRSWSISVIVDHVDEVIDVPGDRNPVDGAVAQAAGRRRR